MKTTKTITDLNELTKKYTAFDTFEEMCYAAGGYTPTIRWDAETKTVNMIEKAFLAGAYDGFQKAVCSGKKSYR